MRALRNIFVVEDNPADQHLLRIAFDELNLHSLTFARDGDEAVRLLAPDGLLPDLVVLDLNVPGKSGLEILAVIKSSQPLRSIPVVVLSSSQSSYDMERARALQASAFYLKGTDLDEFLALGPRIAALWAELNRNAD